MSRVLEPNGAQVLPPADDSRSTVSAYFALLAADGDMRRHAAYRALAASLIVEATS